MPKMITRHRINTLDPKNNELKKQNGQQQRPKLYEDSFS